MATRKRSIATNDEATEIRTLEVITPTQQQFIVGLLAGQSVSASALASGISRRTACYWLAQPDSVVAREYEVQSSQQWADFRNRLNTLNSLAIAALEEALQPEADKSIRFAAAKFLYQNNLSFHRYGGPQSGIDLVKYEASQVENMNLFTMLEGSTLDQIPD